MAYEQRDNVDEKILKVYPYGSRVYKTNIKDSDYDYIVVVESDDENLNYNVIRGNVNVTVYSEKRFIEKIKEHSIDILECIFQKDDDPYVHHFKLDKNKLRHSISAVSSNSYCKCKKKLNQGDYYIGKKSLFHSIRILGFGIQIALSEKIIDYSAYNKYYKMIMDMNTDNWEDYHAIFKPIFNSKKGEFKRYAPLSD